MVDGFLLTTQSVTIAVLVVLAAWLLWMRFAQPINRVFALYLMLQTGLLIAVLAEDGLAMEPSMVVVWGAMATYFRLALPFVMAFFLVVYLRPNAGTAPKIAIAVVAIAVIVAFLLDHCLVECTSPEGTALGPLSLVSYGGAIMQAVVGIVLSLNVGRKLHGLGRSETGLVAGVFLLGAVIDSTITLSLLAQVGWVAAVTPWIEGTWRWTPILWHGLGLVPALIGVVMLAVALRRKKETQSKFEEIFMLAGLALVTGAFVGARPDWIHPGWALSILMIWRVVLPTMVVLALLRYRLFGVKIGLKAVVRSGTVVAVFAGAFFVGSEILERAFPGNGVILGVLGLVAAALAWKPVLALGERVAEGAFPGVKPVVEMSRHERMTAYAHQVQLVWADRRMTPTERATLDKMKAKYKIRPLEADEIEDVMDD